MYAPMVGYLLVAAAAILWGCWAFFLRQADLGAPQSALVLFGVMSAPTLLLLRRGLFADRSAAVSLAVLGFADAFNVLFFFNAVKSGPISIAVLTHYLAPLCVALLAPALVAERWSPRAFIAIPVAVVGLGMLLGLPAEPFPPATAIYGAASAVFFALVILTMKRARRAYSALEVVALHSVISALVLLAVYREAAMPPLEPRTLWVVAGAVLCGLVGSAIFNVGLARARASVSSALLYLEPLTATLIGHFAFAERLGGWALLGAVLILASGAYLVTESPPVDTLPAGAPS